MTERPADNGNAGSGLGSTTGPQGSGLKPAPDASDGSELRDAPSASTGSTLPDDGGWVDGARPTTPREPWAGWENPHRHSEDCYGKVDGKLICGPRPVPVLRVRPGCIQLVVVLAVVAWAVVS